MNCINTYKRIVVAHDHFLYKGGAERVLLTFLVMYPQADVYLAFATKNNVNFLQKHTSGRIITSPFNRIPLAHKLADWFKPALLFWWETLKLTNYNLVISSSHSFSAKSVIAPPGVIHISYIHTPPRYLYDEYNEARWMRHPIMQIVLKPLLFWMRKRDRDAAQRPNILVANSKTVQVRIKKYYGRDSVVIYPPVVIPKRLLKRRPRYYLCVSRLVKQKGIDLAIQVCNKLRESLVIVGKGQEEAKLRASAGSTIEFRGWVPDEKMAQVYAGAKALIFPAIEEDFGIVPIEAMAHGVPVIAYNSGGVRETMIDGKTGVMFNNHTAESLIEAIRRFEGLRFLQQSLLDYARQFSEDRFIRKFTNIVNKHLQEKYKQ